MVRCKFQVVSLTMYNNVSGVTVKMAAVYDTAIPEDRRFSAMTPSGQLEMFVTNPVALAQLQIGTYVYLDMMPVQT